MSTPNPLYSLIQICLLAAPFILLGSGFFFWARLRRHSLALACAAVVMPVLLFVGVAANAYAEHRARTSFLTDLIRIPEKIAPGKTLALTMYDERPNALHLTRTGVATEVVAAVEGGEYWRHDGINPVLNLSRADLVTLGDYGEVDLPFTGGLEDVDYIYVSGHLADFIAIDRGRWGDLQDLEYDLGLVSLIYDVSDGLPVNLITSEPIFRFASTQSVHLRLPNWSTDWSFEKLLVWEEFTPVPAAGRTRFDVLAERVVESAR